MGISKLVLLAVLVAVLYSAEARPTHCERHEGDAKFRCGKEDYKADVIEIRNIVDKTVSFTIDKWLSTCGQPGILYDQKRVTLQAGETHKEEFGSVLKGACNEMYILACKVEDKDTDCLNIVTPSPI